MLCIIRVSCSVCCGGGKSLTVSLILSTSFMGPIFGILNGITRDLEAYLWNQRK